MFTAIFSAKRLFITSGLLLMALILVACGTLEVGLEEVITSTPQPQESEATDTAAPLEETNTPVPATPAPAATETATLEPAIVITGVVTIEPSQTASTLWASYRDAQYGYGFAYPCFWLNIPSTLSSYDEGFAMDNTIRGAWIDNQPPEGVVKIDVGILDYQENGLELSTPLGEAITVVAGDPYGDGRPTFEAIEETTIAGRVAQRVILGESNDSWGGEGPRDSYYFEIAPGRWFHIFILPSAAIDSTSVQGFLSSLALSEDEEIVIPTVDPDPPVAGREVTINQEAGFCFQYPSAYEQQTFEAGDGSNVGDRVSLKLERPLYTVGLTASARPVGAGSDLAELVDGYINGFSDQAAAGIRRNPAELVSGIYYKLGGEAAEALDGVPGPVNTLDIFARHGDLLYQLVFSPSPFDNPQASSDIWSLYNVVTSSFSYLR